jgi:hypothetical protein
LATEGTHDSFIFNQGTDSGKRRSCGVVYGWRIRSVFRTSKVTWTEVSVTQSFGTKSGDSIPVAKRRFREVIMRKSKADLVAVCFLFLLQALEAHSMQERAQTKPGTDYPIQVHISGIHIRTHCGSIVKSCDDVLYADATLNGKKVDLMGEVVPISLSDYVARLAKKAPVTGLQEIGQKMRCFSTTTLIGDAR